MKKAIICLLFFYVANCYSQGGLDNTFSSDGKLVLPLAGGFASVNTVLVQTDGKILLVGDAYNGANKEFAVVRLNNDGTPDNTFDADGLAQTGFGGTWAVGRAGALQSDGKIIVVGDNETATDYEFAIARFNTNGSLDNTFSGDGKLTVSFGSVDDTPYAVAIQSDGKIVVAGYYDTGSGIQIALTRINTNGTLDNTFDGDGKINALISAGDNVVKGIAIQSNGKIVVAGYVENTTDVRFALARFNTNGSLDNTFDGDGKLTTDVGTYDDMANAIAIQSDGKILAAGVATNINRDLAIVRYNSNGSLDNTFDGDGKLMTDLGFQDELTGISVQADAKIVACGQAYFSSEDFVLARFNVDGGTDALVTTDLYGYDDYANSLAIQSDGKIVLAGWQFSGSAGEFAVARYDGTTISVNEINAEQGLQVYPNPASNSIVVSSQQELKNVSVRLMDITGKCVLGRENNSGNMFMLDVSQQIPGVYFLKLKTGLEEFTQKVVISR